MQSYNNQKVKHENGSLFGENEKYMNVPKIIQLPKIADKRGNLSFFESNSHMPFDIKRTYWIYDVPGGEFRGSHAYKENEEFVVALSGSFDIVLDDGSKKETFHMNRSYFGLYIPKMYWREINNFSTNSLALIVANTNYNEEDYIRNYNDFCLLRNEL